MPGSVSVLQRCGWRATGAATRVAVQVAISDEAPTKWDMVVSSVKDSVTHLPENLEHAATVIGDVAKQTGKGLLAGLGAPVLIGAGLLGRRWRQQAVGPERALVAVLDPAPWWWSPSSPRSWWPRRSTSTCSRWWRCRRPQLAVVAVLVVLALVADLVVAELAAELVAAPLDLNVLAALVAIALVAAPLDRGVLAALVAIALVAAVVVEHVTRAPARPGALAVLAPLDLVAAVVAEHVTRAPARPGALVVVVELAAVTMQVGRGPGGRRAGGARPRRAVGSAERPTWRYRPLMDATEAALLGARRIGDHGLLAHSGRRCGSTRVATARRDRDPPAAR